MPTLHCEIILYLFYLENIPEGGQCPPYIAKLSYIYLRKN